MARCTDKIAGSGGSKDASHSGELGEIRAGPCGLILGNEPKAPEYGRVFSQFSCLRFYTEYKEYTRSTELSNNRQSIKGPVLQISQLLRQSIRRCLSRTFFDGSELDEEDLLEALMRHAECWEGDAVDPSVAAAKVTRLVAMGNEVNAVDRVDAIQSRLEQYFENPKVQRIFHGSDGKFKQGPASDFVEAET